MACARHTEDDLDTEIEQLQRSLDHVTREIESAHRQKQVGPIFDSGLKAPKLSLFDERSDSHEGDRGPCSEKPRKREIEARRYNGKEPVSEYLLQFELTAKRNGWSDSEKAVNLLCALDGPARNLLSEIDDVEHCSYVEVKQLLRKRFGPTCLTEIHEQALQEIKLSKGQSIRELASEVQRLVRLAYAEFDVAARTRMAIKALVDAIPDKHAVFYIKDKGPTTADEVCTLYERYRVLNGEDDRKGRNSIHAVKNGTEPEGANSTNLQQVVTDAVNKLIEVTGSQLNKLNAAVTQLVTSQPAALPNTYVSQPPTVAATPPTTLSTPAAPYKPLSQRPSSTDAPRKPCPRCKLPGHWARDCPAHPPTDACFNCGQADHRYRHCPMSLNAQGPGPAPGPRPFAPRH